MICHRKRLKIASALESGQDLPEPLVSHLKTCPACRRFHQQQSLLIDRLQARVNPPSPYPEGLNASILRALRQPASPRAERPDPPRRISPWLAPLSFASVALAIALLLILRQSDPETPSVATFEAPASEVPVVEESVPSNYIRSWSVALNQPLDNELENVVADARSAVRFLAVNFLPDAPEGTNL